MGQRINVNINTYNQGVSLIVIYVTNILFNKSERLSQEDWCTQILLF